MDLSFYFNWVRLCSVRTEVAQALRKMYIVDNMFDEYAELDHYTSSFATTHQVEYLRNLYEEEIEALEQKMIEDTDTDKLTDAIGIYEAAIALENAETGK